MNFKNRSIKRHSVLTFALLMNIATAGCSWSHGESNGRSHSLSDLTQSDSTIVLAGTAECPRADDGFMGGCLRLPEERGNDNSTVIQVFFEYLGEPDSSRETIVVLNGGPGGSLDFYAKLPQLRNLAERYNVLFYDQRGVARSSAITNENVGSIDLNNYGTPENVEDLSDLVSRVVRKPVIVLGHSYGAHLGFAFSVQHPEQVKAYVALNGSSDNLATLLQPGRKQARLTSAIGAVDQQKLSALVQLINEGAAVDTAGKTLSLSDFGVLLSLQVSTFEGQQTGVKRYVETLFAANAEKIGAILRTESLSRNSDSATKAFRLDFVADQEINMFVNKAITCQEMFREESLPMLSAADQSLLMQFRSYNCAGLPVDPTSRIFDTKPLLGQIKSPVLIVSGDSDPLVAPETQQRDFALLKSLGKNVTLWTFKNTGHQTLSESPGCSEKALNEFLTHIDDSSDGISQEKVCLEGDAS